MVVENTKLNLKAEVLLRQLIDCINSTPQIIEATAIIDGAQETVIDVEVDGKQYTLIRTDNQIIKPRVNLSPREKEVVRLVCKGHSNRAIGAVLDISPWTVSTHLRRIYAKLDVGSRAEMVAYVLKDRLVMLENNVNV